MTKNGSAIALGKNKMRESSTIQQLWQKSPESFPAEASNGSGIAVVHWHASAKQKSNIGQT
jgi:hypothetical protein